jgi:diphosphomevalonate decarboxylase
MREATAIAHPNIALVKYWGKRDAALNLPAVPSLSLTVRGAVDAQGAPTTRTKTRVVFGVDRDEVLIAGKPAPPDFAAKALAFLDKVDPGRPPALVDTENDFPTGAGLASSASGFAALALASVAAAGQDVDDLRRIGVLARQGSGSACRSLYGGLAQWPLGVAPDGSDCHAAPVLAPDAWDLALVVGVVSADPKPVGSTAGMQTSRATSPYWSPWVAGGPPNLERALAAVEARDLEALGAVMEASTLQMHAVMHTTLPPIVYWLPETVACLREVWALRARGVGAWSTMDAGPNVKVLCKASDAAVVRGALQPLVPATLDLRPGPGAWLSP